MANPRHIFIGGTGRSGTTLLGTLFDLHPDVLFFGEPQFLANNKGLWDVLHGRCTVEQFAADMAGPFREKMIAKLAVRGFADADKVYAPDRIHQVVSDTLGSTSDPYAAARAFIDALFGLGLKARRKEHWVEKTPNTVLVADDLYRLYPDMKYYHILREPKGVFCSHLRKEWGLKTVPAFIAFYQDFMRRGWERQKTVPLDAYCVLSLERLVHDKERTTRQVFDFAQLACDESLLASCCRRISDDGDHADRWKTMLAPQDILAIDAGCGSLYRRWLKREARSRRRSKFA